jgi:hypothetical protein
VPELPAPGERLRLIIDTDVETLPELHSAGDSAGLDAITLDAEKGILIA